MRILYHVGWGQYSGISEQREPQYLQDPCKWVQFHPVMPLSLLFLLVLFFFPKWPFKLCCYFWSPSRVSMLDALECACCVLLLVLCTWTHPPPVSSEFQKVLELLFLRYHIAIHLKTYFWKLGIIIVRFLTSRVLYPHSNGGCVSYSLHLFFLYI